MRSALSSDHRRKKSQGFSRFLRSTGTTYLSHFAFQEKPFNIIPDPKFLWLGERHKEALEKLRYEILHQDGFIVIRGDVGTGKSTLATILMNELKSQAAPVKVSCPTVGSFDLLKLASSAYKLNGSFLDRGSLLTAFESFLRDSSSAGKKPVLIFDEAQRLTLEHLTELLHLSNLGENGAKWLNLVFVSQNEWDDILSPESHNNLKERIIFNYHLTPLTQEETEEYVLHRLRVARGERKIPRPIPRRAAPKNRLGRLKDAPGEREIFTPEALKEVFLFSRGIPRLINNLCDLALFNAYLEGRKIILPQTVKKCAPRFRLLVETTEWGGNGPDLSSPTERKPGGGKEGEIRPEVNPQTIRENSGKRLWAWSFCSAAGLAVVFFALLFFSSKPTSLLQNLIYPVLKEVSQNNITSSATKAENLSAKGAPAFLPSAAGKLASSEDLERTFDFFAPQEDFYPKAPGKAITPQEIGVAVRETEKQGTADSRTSAEAAKQASTEIRHEEKGPSEKKESFITPGTVASKDKKEKVNPSPQLRAKPRVPESTTKEAEEVEPGRVIEWLLEKKSHNFE